MPLRTAVYASCLLALPISQAWANNLTIISFGGANKAAQAKAYYEPFKKASNYNVVAGEYNGEMAKLKAMVESKSVSWDVLEVESTDLARGCDDGLFEKVDYSRLGNRSDYVSGALQPCGVSVFVWSTALAYNADRLKTAPTGWKDFWDINKYPGKRALRKLAKGTLEIALMADGIAPKDVYTLLATNAGVDRAFRKLDQLKPYIQWWEAGAQPPQYLAAGDVVMSSAYNGRISAAQKDGRNLKVVWRGSMYEHDYWAIPKGSPNKDGAMKFIEFASQPQNQKVYAENIAYGPSNNKTVAMLSRQVLRDLPTSPENIREALEVNVGFWADYGESLEQRFNQWAAK